MAEKHHHFKILLALVLVVGILGLVLFKSGGNTLSLFKVGKFTSTTPSTNVSSFLLELDAQKDAFYGLNIDISGTNFVGDGICQQIIKLGDITVQKSGTRCNAEISMATGVFTYTQAGSIRITAKAESITIDGDIYSSNNPIYVDMEMIPFTFSLNPFTANNLPLSATNGDLTKFRDDLSVSATKNLRNESIGINNFMGSLKLEDGKAILFGSASSIQGLSW